MLLHYFFFSFFVDFVLFCVDIHIMINREVNTKMCKTSVFIIDKYLINFYYLIVLETNGVKYEKVLKIYGVSLSKNFFPIK